MITTLCADREASAIWARTLATCIGQGDLLLLKGPLGSGKTTFVASLLAALGYEEFQASPSFTLINSYASKTSFPVHHLDVYRLTSLDEFIDLGGQDYLEAAEALVLIEWPERIAKLLPQKAITINFGLGASGLSLSIVGLDTAREARLQALLQTTQLNSYFL